MKFKACLLAAFLATVSCEQPQLMTIKTPQPIQPVEVPSSPSAVDPLGPKPALGEAKAYVPAPPAVYKTQHGMTVWLLERHELPLVSITVAIPFGSAADPKGSSGLAHITADMLDEGAGSLSAVALSSAINDLGASLGIGVRPDGSFASLTVLKKNFTPAFAILADVLARPRFEAKEWKRVSELWQNNLKKRGDDPALVSRVVSNAALYGPGTAYGNPSDGLLAEAQKIGLNDAKGFYKSIWRPDQAIFVVVGNLTKDELNQAIDKGLGQWIAPKVAPPTLSLPQPNDTKTSYKPPRLVLVDRPDAPQSVIGVIREGVVANNPDAPKLDLINTALGGSFTSRLMQNLREDHGWTYGARSGFVETRGLGAFVARAAVITEATGPAMKEMLGELSKMASSGLTPEEFAKVKAQDRADLVETYETAGAASSRLATLAMLNLPPNFDAQASQVRQQATMAQLKALLSAVDPKEATIVVVGPKDKVLPQLKAIGLPEPEYWDVEGRPLVAKGSGDKPSTKKAP